MTAATLEAQILSFLQSSRDAQAPMATRAGHAKAKEVESLFTGGVNFLRTGFPNPTIKRLAAVMWDVVGQRITPVCWGSAVPALSFVVAGSKTAPQALILPPVDWQKLLRKDPITQLGALVSVGSQAIDYANERYLEEFENVTTRAGAYEAEYINTIRDLTPSWDLTFYHERLLQEYPEGIATPKASKVLYSAKPLITA